MKEMSWCNKNRIYIYPKPVEHSRGVFRPMCHIQIDNIGTITTTTESYNQDYRLYDLIIEMYKKIRNDANR